MATLVPQTVFTKTAKGILEIRNKSTRLPRELSTLLEHVDGTASVAELQPRSGLAGAQLHHALTTLVSDGYIKAVASPAASVPARDPSAVQFESPDEVARLNMELAAHALASAEATKLAQQEARAALDARLRAEADARARALAESRLQAETDARAAADAAARAAQHERDRAEAEAARAADSAARTQAQAEARSAATAALRSRAEAQARAEAEDRARALVQEKKAAEQRALDEAKAHGEAEQRAQERAAAETRARDALQAQIDAAAAVRSQDDAAARARLHEREEAAERARMEAQAVAQAQGVGTESSTENLHFDDLAQKLTARVHAERRAREEAARSAHAPEAVSDSPKDGFPPLEFASSAAAAQPRAADSAAAAEALPAIDVGSGAGRGDVKHITPEHVPSALERAMMEREARAEADARANGGGTTVSSGGRNSAAPSRGTTAAAREPQSTYESKREAAAAAAAPIVFTPKHDPSAEKTTPTLAEDEPLNERLNVDRTAHDLLAESAEERRKAEVATLSRQAADIRRQRQDEEARRVAREQHEARRRTTARTAAVVLIGVPLLTIAWLQFVPFNAYVPEAQQALSARLNQPTTVSTFRYVLLPTPRVVLEGVRIGSAQAVHVDRVEARAWPGAFLSGPLEFSTVDASGVTIDPGMLATIPAWTGGRSANSVHVSQLRLSDVKLGSADAKMAGMSGEIAFAANGTVNRATLANENLKLDIVPQQSGVKVTLNANGWRVPFGPPVTFGHLTVEGIADKQRFATTQLAGRIGGGAVTGTLAARWEGATTVGGELRIEGARIDEAAQQLAPNVRVKGVLTSNVRYAMQADSASGLMEKVMVEGTFAIARGELGGIDLARAVQLPGTPTGGRTVFETLKGSVQIAGDRYSYRNLQLVSGPLEATGQIDVAPGGQLSGRIDAQMSSRSTVVARSVFSVRGTVKEPQLAR